MRRKKTRTSTRSSTIHLRNSKAGRRQQDKVISLPNSLRVGLEDSLDINENGPDLDSALEKTEETNFESKQDDVISKDSLEDDTPKDRDDAELNAKNDVTVIIIQRAYVVL